MSTENWISQTEAGQILSVSRQQIHRHRKSGILRYRMVKGKRGMVPMYRLSDVQARLNMGAKRGHRLNKSKNRDWLDTAVFDIIAQFKWYPEHAHAVLDFALKAHVGLDELCHKVYDALATSRSGMGDSERFRALCLLAIGVDFEWEELASLTKESPSECQLWRKFVYEFLPEEMYRNVSNFGI